MTDNPSANDLLNIAKGVADMVPLTEEQRMEQMKAEWTTLPQDRKLRILHRRKIRNSMFKILKYEAREMPNKMTPELHALKAVIDEQLDPNLALTWENFTFTWDIHPSGVPKLVIKEAWIREGGTFDPDIGVHMPAAFTEQEIS